MINDSRPKWLRGALGVFAAWWSFWICLVALLALTIGTADAILPGDGIKPLSGAILAIISLAAATLAAIRFVRAQDRYLARRSFMSNCIVLAGLVFVSLALMPIPFVYAWGS